MLAQGKARGMGVLPWLLAMFSAAAGGAAVVYLDIETDRLKIALATSRRALSDRQRGMATLEKRSQSELKHLRQQRDEAEAQANALSRRLGDSVLQLQQADAWVRQIRSKMTTAKADIQRQHHRVVVRLANAWLFRRRSTTLSRQGAVWLKQIGGVLSQLQNSHIWVQAWPPSGSKAAATLPWALAHERALAVARHLHHKAQMRAAQLTVVALGVPQEDTQVKPSWQGHTDLVVLPAKAPVR